jgi:hypothetical protein
MNELSNEAPVTLTITLGDAFTIMAGLSELPAKYSRPLMDLIDSQVDTQFQRSGVIQPAPIHPPNIR